MEGFPSSPTDNVGYPGGGGTIPPAGTPARGMTIIPMPGLTNHMGRIVGCPSSVVVVAESAVNPWMDFVVVEYWLDPAGLP